MINRIGVLTSGGDAPGMNAAIRAVVRTGLSKHISTIGFKHGFNGLLMRSSSTQDDFLILTSREVSGTVHRGGTGLMTARCMEFLERENQIHAVENLRSLGVEGLICIGGNGTYHGAAALKELGFPVVGVPGTIDNDMAYTDYCIGFDTAINTAIESVDRIRDTCGSHERASLITVMGRDCGEIALHTGLACGAEIVMLPEIPWSLEEVSDKVKWASLNGKNTMIIIFAEGAHQSLTSDVDAICASNEKLEGINSKNLSSSGIARIIETLSGHEVRATVLGYTQRGGNPSAKDRVLASRLGAYAVDLLENGIYGEAVGVRGEELIHVPVEEAMNSSADRETVLKTKQLIEMLAGI